MRKIILILLVCAMTTSGHAMDFDFKCEELASTAEQMMSLRQHGVSKASQLRDMREKVDEYEETKLYEEMIEEAYARPQRSTMEDRFREIRRFRMERFDYCKKMEALFLKDSSGG